MYYYFASVYDTLRDDFDYDEWSRHYLRLIRLATGELPRRAEHARQVDHVVLEQPLNAVAHAVNMLYAVLAAGAEIARKAGIDDTGGAAALADNRVDAHACNRSLSIFFRVMARPSRCQAILSIIPSG